MRPAFSRARGFSLLELAVALVILGVVTLALWQFAGTATVQRQAVAQRDLLGRADDAVAAFVLVNHRLPCPAGDNGGIENCTLQVGLLPYRTLGLPDAAAGRMRYGAGRRPSADPMNDADLAVAKDRFRPLVTSASGVAVLAANPNSPTVNGLDFCQALRNAMRAPVDAAALHTRQPLAPGTVAVNVAYALALPTGIGADFTGSQAAGGIAFDAPGRPAAGGDPEYHDQVRATGFAQLWTRLRCGDALAAAGHAHFNVLAAVGLYHQSLVEYEKQLEIAQELAEADVALSVADVAAGGGAIANAAAELIEATASATGSTGAASFEVALAVAATVAASAAEAAAAATVAISAEGLKQANDNVTKVGQQKEAAQALYDSVLANAAANEAADSYGAH
jgi:prepilin-type N-terminal cleavage/methylation domain-containing protein